MYALSGYRSDDWFCCLQLAYVQEKLFIGLEHAGPAFGVKDRILGPVVSLQSTRIHTHCCNGHFLLEGDMQ